MSPVSPRRINQANTNESRDTSKRVKGKVGSQPLQCNPQQGKAKEASQTTSAKPPQPLHQELNVDGVLYWKDNQPHWSHRHPTLRERGMVATRASGNPKARVKESPKEKARTGRRERTRARAHGPVPKERRKASTRKESASPKATHSTSFLRQPQRQRTPPRQHRHLCVVIFAISLGTSNPTAASG